MNSIEPRDYNPSEVGILADLGYTLKADSTAVPEPTSMIMLLNGIGGAVGVVRRKKGSAHSTLPG